MEQFDYKKVASYWENIEEKTNKMPREELLKEINSYINENTTCALATACDDFVRCTPLEYTYYNGNFYFFSEGGLKFRALEKNKNVAMAIFDKFSSFSNLKGLQISGKAQIVEPFSDEYLAVVDKKGLKIEKIKKVPNIMNLIKVVPTEMSFINSSFSDRGFFVRQHIKF